MRQPCTLRRLGLGIALALLAGGNAAFAIEQDQPFLMESWTLAPGTVFEILATSGTPDQQVTWSLTKADGTFVQADRGPLFRERFVGAGDFLLRGEVAAADRTPLTQRTFAIHIVADAPAAPAATRPLVETDPPSDANGIVILDANHQTALLRAANGATNLTADFNSDQDADGDGDPTNDPESRGTFFEADGSALRIWFTDGNTNRTITVRGTNAAGPATQTVRLSSDGPVPTTPAPEQPLVAPSGLELIRIEDRGNGTYSFSVDPTALSADGRPLLFHWDFGDGRQSMLDRPVHLYAANGAFTVILRVRDLTTTDEVLRVTGILPVSTVAAPSSSSSAPDGTSSSSTGTGTAEPSSSGLKTILMIVAGLLLAVGAGLGIVLLIGKVVRRRLDAGPENPPAAQPAKKTTPSAPPSLDLPPPMAVIDAEPAPETPLEQNRDEDARPAAAPKLSELSFKEEEAPSWLKQGHEEAEKRGHTVVSAAPSAPVETVPPPTPTAESRPLPPWLEPVPPTAEATPLPTPPPAAPAPTPPLPPKADTPKLPEPPTPPPPAQPVTPPPPPPPAPVAEPPVTAPTEEAKKEELTPAERERRRKKRARYRANKKKREEETAGTVTPQETAPAHEPKPDVPAPPKKEEESPTPPAEPVPLQETGESDEPIAIIRADNISKDQKDKKKS